VARAAAVALRLAVLAGVACAPAGVGGGDDPGTPDDTGSPPAPRGTAAGARGTGGSAGAGPGPAAGERPTPADAQGSRPDGGAADAAAGAGADAGPSRPGDAGPEATGTGAPPLVFDLTVLHEVKIVVEPQYLPMLETDRVSRVPAMFSYDGQIIGRAGLRKKGSYGSWTQLSGKPAFTVKFDEFVPGLKIQGLDKLSLNNCRQDATLVAEHVGYELYRRAKLPAPFTAHAVVTFNGAVKGIYVVAEATNKGFLRRNFGKDNDEGNLYEGGYLGDVDFVLNPERLDLKREKEEMRTREDVVALARAIRTTPVAEWANVVGGLLDIPAFISAYAIDGLTNHWDSYPYNANNYYLYRRPTDKRFIMIPHGMDSLFQIDVVFGQRALMDVYWTMPPPNGSCRACGLDGDLARRLRAVPALDAEYRGELQRILREVWDLDVLNARIDQVARLVRGAKLSEAAIAADARKFDQHIPAARKFLADRRAQLLR
jgi:hypothetical protein